MTSDINGKRVNELVENDQIFEKEKSDFIYILPFGNGLRQLFCMDLMLNHRDNSKAYFDIPFIVGGGQTRTKVRAL